MTALEERWSEISPLLDEALDLPGSARESWLKNLESRAPELAAHVRSCLLGVAEVAGNKFLEAPIHARLPTGLEGHAIGAYTLEKPLGFGGMGTSHDCWMPVSRQVVSPISFWNTCAGSASMNIAMSMLLASRSASGCS